MKVPFEYGNLNYYSFNRYLKNRFGKKVYRISVDAGFTCPNRDGTKGIKGCYFCNEKGSRASYVKPQKKISEQISYGKKLIGRRYRAEAFIAYFQAYTNTYAPPELLKEVYRKALKDEDVIGMAVGTRPDCISPAVLDAMIKAAGDKWVLLEIGVQTMNDQALNAVNRGHGSDAVIKALNLISRYPEIDVLTHLISGLPGNDVSQTVCDVRELTDLGVRAFKFHHLYVEKNTVYAKWYEQGKLNLLSKEEYFEILSAMIAEIHPSAVIHRLFGQSDPQHLIAPLWTLNKNQAVQDFDSYLKANHIIQGIKYQKRL